MKILVCGSRHFTNERLLYDILDEIAREPSNRGEPIVCIHGAAKGADSLAGKWAACSGWEVQAFPADWNKYGKAAGPIRNRQMLKEGKPDLIVAFLAPNSRGTKDMIEVAQKAGIPVTIVPI